MNTNFNLIKYQKMLANTKAFGYEFVSFNNSELLNENLFLNKKILLRHDIDVCPKAAYEMAKTESKIGIKATYFFMLRSPLYNFFSRANFYFISKIIELGHDLGLHYDAGFYKESDYDAKIFKDILFQKNIIENEFNIDIKAVSFHQPNRKILDSLFKFPKGLINTYSKEINLKFKYYSDTNQEIRWVDTSKINLIDSLTTKFPENIQLLIHPIWWVYNKNTPQKTWTNALQKIFNSSQEQLVAYERAFGKRRLIDIRDSE